MPDLDHLSVTGFTTDRSFQSTHSFPKPSELQRDREQHGSALLRQLAKLRLDAEALSLERAKRGLTTSTGMIDRKSTRLNSSHQIISYAVFCLKKKNTT